MALPYLLVAGDVINCYHSHGFNTEPGWAVNEEFRVKSPENFDVQSARRASREHLDCVQKHRRYNGLRNGHKERNHNNCGVGL
jgi:hypothetical protein